MPRKEARAAGAETPAPVRRDAGAITVRRGDACLVYALDDGTTVTYARVERRTGEGRHRRVETFRRRTCSACGEQPGADVCAHVAAVRAYRLARLGLTPHRLPA